MTEPETPEQQQERCKHHHRDRITAFEDETDVYLCRDCGAEIKGRRSRATGREIDDG